MRWRNYCIGLSVIVVASVHAAPQGLLNSYSAAGVGPYSSMRGEQSWVQKHQPAVGEDSRSCASCHGTDLRKPGRHIKTGKTIEPMALSVTAGRLSDPSKVEKWFRRNCRWTLGRECLPQEKGDFIQYITSQ